MHGAADDVSRSRHTPDSTGARPAPAQAAARVSEAPHPVFCGPQGGPFTGDRLRPNPCPSHRAWLRSDHGPTPSTAHQISPAPTFEDPPNTAEGTGRSARPITVSTVAAFVASWPLVAAIWDLLGFTTGQAARVGVLSACALLLTAGITRLNRGRTAPVRLVWLVLGAWTVAAGAIAIMTGLAWIVLGAPQWAPPGEITPRGLDSIARTGHWYEAADAVASRPLSPLRLKEICDLLASVP